jgi:glycosyltransferase involved in cell wall biosynthesis
LSFTTLFPNPERPDHGLFIKNRLKLVAEKCRLTVVAPINVAQDPPLAWRVPYQELLEGMTVYHPWFAVIPGLFKQWDGRLLYQQSARQMRRSLNLNQYDLIDVHFAYPDGVAGQYLAEELGKPFIISLRGSDLNVLGRFPRRRRLIQSMLARASAVIAVSEALKRKAEAIGVPSSRVHIIPNGVDTSVFYPRNRLAARARLGWPEGIPCILSVGRLSPIKGFELLIETMAALHASLGSALCCFIVGEGELRPALERQIARLGLENVVRLCGRVPQVELAEWYSAADAFCLLSHNEGCPNVVLESLACGTPVVATGVGGVPEILRQRAAGTMVLQRDANEVAEAIHSVLVPARDQETVVKASGLRPWSEVANAQVSLFERVVNQL